MSRHLLAAFAALIACLILPIANVHAQGVQHRDAPRVAQRAAGPETAFEGRIVHQWDFNEQARTERQWAGWSSPNTTADFQWSADGGRDGSGALHTKAYGQMTSLWRVDVPVVGGGTYEFSAWVRLRNGQGFTFLAGRTMDEDGGWVSAGNFSGLPQDIFLRGDTGWQQLRVQFHTPDTADTITLFLANRFGDGDEVWFDDVVLKEAVGPVTRRMGPALASEAQDAAATLREADQLPGALDQRLHTYTTRIARELERLGDGSGIAPHISIRRDAWAALREGVQLQRQLQRQAEFVRFEADADAGASLATAWVDSTQRVFIDDLPLEQYTPKGRIELFAGEREAAQLVLVPFTDQSNVAIRLLIPAGASEPALTADDLNWRVVGYVNMKQLAGNAAGVEAFPFTGWWPDPLLNLEQVVLEAGAYQPIWIEARAPRGTPPGEYTFDVEVIATDDGDDTPRVLARSNLTVEVLHGELPEQWYLDKMLSFSSRLANEPNWSGDHKTYVHYGDRWHEVADKYYDLLLDYRIGIGSFYEPIDSYSDETLLRAADAGQNIFFTVAGRASQSEDGDVYIARHHQRQIDHAFSAAADKMESLGLLDQTYFYSFDEHWPWTFPVARDVFEQAKQRGYTTMSTLHDTTYGTDSILTDVLDVYVPSQRVYDKQLARKARKQGKKVWWYTTGDFNIETDVIYQRLRMWRTMAVEADGYLIWAMNRWVGNEDFINGEVRTNWNPRLDDVTPSSSAMMIYPGEDGPVSSIRLENFRDGVEDYDLLAATALRIKQPDETFHEATGRLLEQLGVPRYGLGIDRHSLRDLRRRLANRIAELDGKSD